MVVASEVEVRGVQVDVGEPSVVEWAVAEGLDSLVQLGADAAHLAPGDPRGDLQRGHQVVDRASGDPLHAGLHHDGVEGLVDSAAGLQERGEVAAPPQLGDPDFEVAGLGRQGLRPVAVALGEEVCGPLVAGGADHQGSLGSPSC